MKKFIPYAIMIAYVVLHTVLLLEVPLWKQITATLMLAVPLSLLANFAYEVGGWQALIDIILCRNTCDKCNGTGLSLTDDEPSTCCKCNGTGLKHYKGDI
jgi:hypothetical protein